MKSKTKKNLIKKIQKTTYKVNNATIALQNFATKQENRQLLVEGTTAHKIIHIFCMVLYFAIVGSTWYYFGLLWAVVSAVVSGLITGAIERLLDNIFVKSDKSLSEQV